MKINASREFQVISKLTDNMLTASELLGDDEVMLDMIRCLAVTIGRIYGHYSTANNAASVLARQQLDEALNANGLQRTKED